MHIARYIEIMMSAPNAMQNSVVTMFSIADLSRLKSVEYPVGYSKDINRSKKIFFFPFSQTCLVMLYITKAWMVYALTH